MDPELYRRVAELEKAVKVLLDLNVQARDILRPKDAMAIADDKRIQGSGLLPLKEDYPETQLVDLGRQLIALYNAR